MPKESEKVVEDPPPQGFNFLGIRMAPLSLPWSRRMETLSVALWMYTFLMMGPLASIFLVYIFFKTTYGWILSTSYLAYLLYDKDICNRGGRRWTWVRNWQMWRHYCNYFPISLIKTVDLDPSKNYLFCYHPHGVLCCGAVGSFGGEGRMVSQVFPGITTHLLTLEGHYSFPFYRDYVMSLGGCSASKSSLDYLLTRPEGGHAAVLVPGGAPEALDSHPGHEIIVHVKRRKGFVKMAIRHGVSIVPVFSFGENNVYDQIANPEGSWLRSLQDRLQKILGLAPVLFMGRGIFQYNFGVVPKRHPIYVVVGAPVPTTKTANPTQEAIDETHKRYADALMQLFEKYKHIYGSKDDHLVYV